MNEIPDAADQQATPPALTSAPAEPRYKGVGGWLLLLCLGLTVFGPAMTLYSLSAGYTESSPYFDQFPGLKVVTVVDALLCFALMAFSIYAGAGLWTIRPGAVQVAKKYLLCFLGYHAVEAILPFLAGLPAAANEAMIVEVVKEALKGVLYFAIWYSYLNKSERVRSTYAS
jgi:Protein of unknown function (DUF2569)